MISFIDLTGYGASLHCIRGEMSENIEVCNIIIVNGVTYSFFSFELFMF